MNSQIVIYHEPQECGCPYFTIVSAETGQVLQTIDLPYPSGFYDNGIELVEQSDFLFEKTEKRHSDKFPQIGAKETYRFGRRNGKRTEFRVVENVKPIKDEYIDRTFLYHTYEVTYNYFTTHTEKKWDASKDEYRKEMERLGFDMSKWHAYNRRKVAYKDFLRSLFPNALNMIFIG